MDEVIEALKEGITEAVKDAGSVDPARLAGFSSSLKDLCIARFIEDLRSGKLVVHKSDLGGTHYWIQKGT